MAKAVAKKEVGGNVVPDHLKKYAGKGTVGIDMEDVAIPRLTLLQQVSPQVMDGMGKAGEWFHLISDDNFGNEITIIPIMVTKSYMLWRPRKTGGGLLARADDGIHWTPPDATFSVQLEPNAPIITWKTAPTVKESGLADWGSENPENPQSPPAATKMMNVLCWLPDHPQLSPSVLTLQRSSLSVGKKFVGKLKMSQVPTFGLRFIAKHEKVVGPSGEYFRPIFVGDGFVEDVDLVEDLNGMYDHFMEVGLKVQEAGLQDEESEGGGSGGAPSGDF